MESTPATPRQDQPEGGCDGAPDANRERLARELSHRLRAEAILREVAESRAGGRAPGSAGRGDRSAA